jgi:peroxiredoxin-like protein
MAEAPRTPPGVKHKTFTYRTSLDWVGGRAAIAASPGKASFRVSSPPEFKGEDGVWTPEDLFVAAVDICMMTTFLAFASRAQLPVASYTSEAVGTLEFTDGAYRVTRITLRPTIVVEDETALSRVEETLAEAHRACIVSNSIRTDVSVEPLVRMVTETVPVA